MNKLNYIIKIKSDNKEYVKPQIYLDFKKILVILELK